MKLYKHITAALLLGAIFTQITIQLSAEESMDKMWGETKSEVLSQTDFNSPTF